MLNLLIYSYFFILHSYSVSRLSLPPKMGQRDNKKRKAQESPEKDSPASDQVKKISDRTIKRVEDLKVLMAEAEAAKVTKDMKEVFVKYLKSTIKHEEDANTELSDLMQTVIKLEKKAGAAEEKAAKADDKVKEIEKVRETVEIKASRKDMAAKMEYATTQVKVMDLDFERSLEEQKEMVRVAKLRLTAKIKKDDQPKFTELVSKAGVAVLARKTAKRKARESGEDIWTAPVVMTIPEKSERWEMEDLLRRNKIFPTFHWPKDFLDPLKKMREELKKKVDEEESYIRIRPAFSDGKWKIRADAKPKGGNAKFTHAASWEMPPADESTRNKVKNWFKPSWADVVSGRARLLSQAPSTVADGGDCESEMEEET